MGSMLTGGPPGLIKKPEAGAGDQTPPIMVPSTGTPDRSALIQSIDALGPSPGLGNSYPVTEPQRAATGPDLKTRLITALGGVQQGMQQQDAQGRQSMQQMPPMPSMQLPQFAASDTSTPPLRPYQPNSKMRKNGQGY